MFCKECGSSIPDEARFCPVCRAKQNQDEPVKRTPSPRTRINEPTYRSSSEASRKMGDNGYSGYHTSGISRIASDALRTTAKAIDDAATNNRPTPSAKGKLMDGMKLAEGEKIVRQYDCCNMKSPRCIGRLSVTNKRLIYQGSANKSRISDEIELDKVTGVSGFYGKYYRWGTILIGALLTLFGIILFIKGLIPQRSYFGAAVARSSFPFLGFILLIIGIVLILNSSKDTYRLIFYASECSMSPIAIGLGSNIFAGQKAEFSVLGAATEDTDKMLSEIGALVQDLKTMGDHAIEKWSL